MRVATGRARRIAGAAGLWARALRVTPPVARDLPARLAMLPGEGWPVAAPVEILWNEFAVPFIIAGQDADLPVAIGAVQGHLRLAQLEAMRRIATGRVAELVGPLGLDVDRTVHLMGFSRAVPEIIAAMAPETRRWAQGFLDGLNHVIQSVEELPYELRMLGAEREAWTLTELMTVARLASADVSWIVFSRLFRARHALGAAWPAVLSSLVDAGSAAPGGIDAAGQQTEDVLARLARMGSNSAAVGGDIAASGAAMIASDPHLSLGLPNLWMIAGMESPGVNAVGLMLAGFPFVALGRNRDIAWGGTNLHAASSDLVDLAGYEDRITERRVTVRVRGGGEAELVLRESPWGPVVSDGLLFRNERPFALRWVGHAPSDELGAMLRVLRARDWEGFRAAFGSFAIPAQTMVFAGTDGQVGQVIAARLPHRHRAAAEAVAISPDEVWGLDELTYVAGLPEAARVGRDVAASANDRPPEVGLTLGHFFSPPDRVRRLHALLGDGRRLELADMRAVQNDTHSAGALRMRDQLLEGVGRTGKAGLVLAAWDGRYDPEAAGPVVFETLLAYLADQLVEARRLVSVAGMWTGRQVIAAAILRTPPPVLRREVQAGLREAGKVLRRTPNWGVMHRVALRHPMARLPVLGRRFRWGELEAPGGNTTLSKTGHGLVRRRHRTSFGTCARHLSDLSDPDANYFVLLGGQDGFIGSANIVDQAVLWRQGDYVWVPLRGESARARFAHRTVLQPG